MFKVREPYQIRNEFKLLEGILSKTDTAINIVPATHGMCLWLDGSYDCIKLKVGDRISVFPYQSKVGSFAYRLAKPTSKE